MGLLLTRAKANTTTTGTVTVTLGTAVVPYQTWSSAGAVSGYWYDYLIEDTIGGVPAWETGVGYYNGTTLTRPGASDPWFSSSSGSLLSLSGSATIACVANPYTLESDGPFMPPKAADFTLANTSSPSANISTFQDDKRAGLIMAGPAPTLGNDCYRYAYKALPSSGATDWEVHVRIRLVNWLVNYGMVGIGAIESSTSKIVTEMFGYNSGQLPRWLSFRRGTLTAFGADLTGGSVPYDTLYFRIAYVNSTTIYTMSVSLDRKTWCDFYAAAASTFFTTRADRVALLFFNSGTNTCQLNASVPYWWQSW